MTYRSVLFASVALSLLSCHAAPNSKPGATGPTQRSKVALVVMDGFGLGKVQEGNAIATALQAAPEGFLNQALNKHVYPMLELGASGECVGLAANTPGNSEAGHSNMCAEDVVVQRRTYIDDLIAQNALLDVPTFNAAVKETVQQRKPLHVFAFVAAYSSAGHYHHVMDVLRVAHAMGQSDVQLHLLCDGSGDRPCNDMLQEIADVMKSLKVGTVATLSGRDWCFGKGDPTHKQQKCFEAMRQARTGKEPTWQQVVPKDIAQDDGLEPTALANSAALGPDDTLIVLLYRRDDPQALIRTFRQREKADSPVSNVGPRVLTFGALDDVARYDDDPNLEEVFALPAREGFLNKRLTAAGLTQARLAESKKMAHVTYFCDGAETPQSNTYRRVHLKSVRNSEAARKQPCLQTPEVVEAAMHEADLGVDFIMMNLPNADLLGHTADYDAAVKAVTCLDTQLGKFVEHARGKGYSVFVTGDHGNAEEMLRDGVWHGNHSQNHVPFVAMAPLGQPPLTLIKPKTLPCLSRVSWTMLDALRLPSSPEKSLIAHPWVTGGHHED